MFEWLLTVPSLLLLTNAVLGLFMFEWAWSKTRRFRNPNKELNKIFWMFERKDAKYWARWKFYPGAITILVPRIMLGMISLIMLTLIVSLLLIGHNINEPLADGCRKWLIRNTYKVFVSGVAAICWFSRL
jgi:hypothetical protein